MSLFDWTEEAEMIICLTEGRWGQHGHDSLNGIHRLIDKRRDQLGFFRNGFAQFFTHIKIPWREVFLRFWWKDYCSSLSLKLLIVFVINKKRCFYFQLYHFEAVFLMLWLFLMGYCTKETCLQHIYSNQNSSVDFYSFFVEEEHFLLRLFFFFFLAGLRDFYSF